MGNKFHRLEDIPSFHLAKKVYLKLVFIREAVKIVQFHRLEDIPSFHLAKNVYLKLVFIREAVKIVHS